MNKKRQNIILNVLMIAAIALTMFSGIMTAGSLQRTEATGTPAPTLNISALNGTENQTNEIPEESGITISDPMTVAIVDDAGTVKRTMQAMISFQANPGNM